MKNPLKVLNTHQSYTGFTLIELLIAAAVTTIVVGVAGYGLVAIMGANRKAEAETERRVELNRGLDFIADEIRTARRVNTTNNITVGASTAINNSVTTYGTFDPTLGSIGNTVLYLEIPIASTFVGNCPTGTPRNGLPPATFDRVVYDIRENTSTWLGPRVINRYGRIPKDDGTINPCSNPVASEALVDAVESTDINPTNCVSPAILSGAQGFYACVNGRQVDLYLRGQLTDALGNSTDPLNVKTRVFVRSVP